MKTGHSAIIPSTNWAKGGADIFSFKRRRVAKRSMVGKGRGDEGKRTTKMPQLNTKESTRSHDPHVS